VLNTAFVFEHLKPPNLKSQQSFLHSTAASSKQAPSLKEEMVRHTWNKSSTSPSGNDDSPLFFYLPDAKYGEFCQWFPSPFSVSRGEIASLVGYDDGTTTTTATTTPCEKDEDENSGGKDGGGDDTKDEITVKDKEPTVTDEGHIKDTQDTKHDEATKNGPDSGLIQFNCAEQFMMYCKAARFHDVATQARVMATSSPKEQKRLGKLTRGFFDASWDEVKGEVVIAGNMAKFTQNDKLRGKLLATGRRVLVEASGRDRVWGIGYTEKHAMRFQEHWGENRLGKALMVVRDRLRIKELL